MNYVIMSMDFVPEVVWMGILEDIVTSVRFVQNYIKKHVLLLKFMYINVRYNHLKDVKL